MLTDCAPLNLAYWEAHSELKPLFAMGVLDASFLTAQKALEEEMQVRAWGSLSLSLSLSLS